ncbi:ras-like protein rasb [Anaeramoeba ignava]|uniref:small monomeric GTPase n=1 Tax=Anaeramoeba ignava TaxID=1746090 RepID=A0A9Q0LGB0_ANAIG|nr:ras-like protein rasb [Anaeramoeba ignava]
MNRFKIVVVGPGAVGKSALTIQYVNGEFVSEYDPTLEDSYRKQAEVDNQVCLLDILDTAGQEDLVSMKDQNLRSGQGFLIVFSVTSKHSFSQVAGIRDEILRAKDSEDVPIILIANKVDLVNDRVVTETEIRALADDLAVPFLETSAKTKVNVDEAFAEIVRILRKKGKISNPTVPSNSSKKKKWRCFVM